MDTVYRIQLQNLPDPHHVGDLCNPKRARHDLRLHQLPSGPVLLRLWRLVLPVVILWQWYIVQHID